MPRKKKHLFKLIGGPFDGKEYKSEHLSKFVHIPVVHKPFTPDEYYISCVYEYGYKKGSVYFYRFHSNQKVGKKNA